MTNTYAVVSNVDGLFAMPAKNRTYTYSSGNQKYYWLDNDATTVMNHMNSEYDSYTWSKEAGPTITLDIVPSSIDTPQNSYNPKIYCICYKIINGTKYYVKDSNNMNDLDSDINNAEITNLTSSEINTIITNNPGLHIDHTESETL